MRYIVAFMVQIVHSRKPNQKLSDLKSLNFPIIYRHAENLSTAATTTFVDYIYIIYLHYWSMLQRALYLYIYHHHVCKWSTCAG